MDSFSFESVFSKHDGHFHPHACIIFDALESYRRVAFHFIREGLEENEKCVMAVDSYTKSLIARDFAGAGLDMEAYLQSGRLAIINVRASYANNGGFDPDATIETWKAESMRAASEGFHALRVVGEAAFALEGPGLYEQLIYYENIINQVLFKKYPFKSLCVYDKNRYPADVIKAAIQAHPVLFYNEELFLENIHYVPPEIHFKKERAPEEIDRWLENVRKNNKNLKELKSSNERLDLALDFSNEGVWDWNLKTNEIYFSPNWKKLLGYENHEIKNDFSEWERLTRPDHVQKAWKEFEDVIAKKRYRFEVELQMRHKEGRWVDILSRANVVFDANGKAFRMVGTHVDITDRKQAEEALAWQARRNELLSETASRLLQSEAPQKIVEDLCRSVMDFLDCQAFFNFLADDKTGRLHLNAYAGIPEAEAGRIEWLDYGVTVCGCVARDGQRMIVEQISGSADVNVELIKSFGIEAYCCHPIMIQDRVMGTLSFGTHSRSQFQEGELRLMEEVTNLVAVAMSRAESERKVRETSAILQTAMDCSTAGIAIADAPDGKLRFVNEAALSIRGASKEDLVSDVHIDQYVDNWQILHFDGTPYKSGEVPLARAVKYGERCDRQFIIRRPGNEDRVVWASAAPVLDDQGHVIYGIVVFPDITEFKQSEEALRESEEKYRLLVENADDGIYVAQDENIKFLNPGLEKITGYAGDELMQTNFNSFIHPEDRGMVMARYKRRMAGETPPIHYSFRILHKNGEVHWVEINAALIQWNGRAATLNFLRDITEQKKLETQLQQAQKMEAIGTLAGGIAHDFNNILSSVIGFTELSMDELESGSFLHGNLSEVMNAGNRAKDLVKQILTLSRQEEQEKKPVNIVPLLKEALKMLRSTVPTSIEIKQNISSQNLVVYADPTQIHQVIMNLATNAVHAMADMEGSLEVRTQLIHFDQAYMDLAAGSYVKISVSDTGASIPYTVKDKIFEPYFTTKEKGHGTGLGLSVVHGIVKSHNGHINVYSEPGAGTRFNVYLPRAACHSVESASQPSVQLPTGNESILIVDDELPIVKMHQQSLEHIGYKTTARSSSVEALQAFKASPNKYDLIITDMTMPQMTGEKLARAVKEIRPDIPVVLCTGFSERVEEYGKELAIDGILMKPIDKKEMAETVRDLIDRSTPAK